MPLLLSFRVWHCLLILCIFSNYLSILCLILPVATPPNAIAFSCGYLKVYNMVTTHLLYIVNVLISLSLSVSPSLCLSVSLSGECTGGYKDGSLKLLNELTITPQNARAIQRLIFVINFSIHMINGIFERQFKLP